MTLKTLRKEKGFIGNYVAKKMGLQPATYSAKERGERKFSAKEILRLSVLLDVPVETIIECFEK